MYALYLSISGVKGGNRFSGSGGDPESPDFTIKNPQVSGNAEASAKFLASLDKLFNIKASNPNKDKNYFQLELVKIVLELILDNSYLQPQSAANLAVTNGMFQSFLEEAF